MASYLASNAKRDTVTLVLSNGEANALRDLALFAEQSINDGLPMNSSTIAAAKRAVAALSASTNASARRAGYFEQRTDRGRNVVVDISDETLDAMDTTAWQEAAPWGEFKSDLILTVHHTLTEPTCPTARVEFELKRGGTLSVCCHGNTIQEAIDAALSAALARLRAERGEMMTTPKQRDRDRQIEEGTW